ncbi:hypothetical protein [Kitasatospora camelliae]|uniref:Uncharacterized protein n=1 Tax=Kitasatospora camelliae TaxID=3156397 RepID=A0AAU8K236_9ACTN
MNTTDRTGPRGLSSLIPVQAPTTAGQRAAAQMLGLREVTLPAAVVSAAAELLAEHLDDPDPVTREATAVVLARLRAAVGPEQPQDGATGSTGPDR